MILQYSDLLQTLAQVSITLAGFIGVILVFRHTDQGAKNAIFHLLYTSLGVFTLALLPLMMQPVIHDGVLIDRICCPLMGIWHGFGATRAHLEARRNEIAMPAGSTVLFSIGSYVLVVLGLAVGFGFFLDFAGSIYFVGLGWLIAVAISAFVSLMYHGAD